MILQPVIPRRARLERGKSMRYITIPRTNLQPSIICLGTSESGVKNSETRAREVMSAFVNRGGTFIDTARIYSDWAAGESHRSERIIGDWLMETAVRNKVILATKCGLRMEPGAWMKVLLSPECIREDLAGSLELLRTDYIDLFYVHADDPSIPVGEIIDTLDECAGSGLIRHYACSNWSLRRMREAHDYASSKGSPGFVAHQMMWNVGLYGSKGHPPSAMNRAMYRFMKDTSMAALPWSSQANGYFTKLARAGGIPDEALARSPYHTERNLKLYALMEEIAATAGISVTGVVLQYLLCQQLVTIPLAGMYSIGHLDDTLAAADELLPPEAFRRIDEAAEMDIKDPDEAAA